MNQGGIGNAQLGQYFITPIIRLPEDGMWTNPLNVHLQLMREAEEREKCYRESLMGKLDSAIYLLRGRFANWIAPDGWFDE